MSRAIPTPPWTFMVYYRQTLLILLKCFEVNGNMELNKSDFVNSKIPHTNDISVKNMLNLHTNIRTH